MHLDTATLRPPTVRDGVAMRRLVDACGVLEPNTAYAYLLLCTHFADTCLVAEDGDGLVGFVAAYRPPTRPEAVFVWQVGVAPRARGQRLASRLLQALVDRASRAGARYLEATVGRTNQASQRLFRALARDRGVPCEVGPGFTREHFAPLDHEPEDLFRVGPFRAAAESLDATRSTTR